MRLFLRARAAIKCVLRAASTLEITDGEQRALRKFSRRNLDLSLLGFAPSHLADTVQPISAAYSQLCLQCDTLGGRSKRSKAFFLVRDIVNTSREEALSYHTFKCCDMEGFWLY